MNIDKKIYEKFPSTGPRYTSYPTAPEWKTHTDQNVMLQALTKTKHSNSPLSLYIHIPFCQSLCYYCGCNVSIRKHDSKYGTEYLDMLEKEIEQIIKSLGKKKNVQQFHLGGGTPTFLSNDQLDRLIDLCKSNFNLLEDAECAIEIDPRTVTKGQIKNLKRHGFNRISMGVQDIDPKVQEAINRIHTKEMILDLVNYCREIGFKSINLDLIYGLPYQTLQSIEKTIDFITEVKPNRIAMYSFAHVPWVKKHQRKIEVAALPSSDEKLKIFSKASKMLCLSGYSAIGMDHFALSNDEMSLAYDKGELNRNFMGYTVLPAENFLGLGASSISYLEGSYIQNIKRLPEYYKAINNNFFAIEKDFVLSKDDLIRKYVIEKIMCAFVIDTKDISQKFNINFQEYFKHEQKHLNHCLENNLIKLNDDSYHVTELGKSFVRNLAMGFDHYLRNNDLNKPRFSKVI
jgi:oxygen-independent coproporphyrinogen III oxidase